MVEDVKGMVGLNRRLTDFRREKRKGGNYAVKVKLWMLILLSASVVLFNGVGVRDVAASPTDWPMFHQNLNHTGVTPDIVPPPLTLLWNYTAGDEVDCSPAISGGTVYVDSFPGNVYALNADTGAVLWTHETGGGLSSPAVVNGMVYVGSGDHNVYALNAETGAVVWNYTTGDKIYSSPAVSGGIVYVGSEDGNVYALNAETGAVVWTYTTGGPVDSSPAVSGGTVYVGSGDHKVYALSANTGAIIWSYRTRGAVDSSPAVSGGIVYVGSEDGSLYALNAETGTVVWNYKTSGGPSSPAVSGNTVYVGSWDGNVYAFAAAASNSQTTAATATTSAFNVSSMITSSTQPSPSAVPGVSSIMTLSPTTLVLTGVAVALAVLLVAMLRRPKLAQPPTSQAAKVNTIYCEQCGSQSSAAKQFCEKCEAKLKP